MFPDNPVGVCCGHTRFPFDFSKPASIIRLYGAARLFGRLRFIIYFPVVSDFPNVIIFQDLKVM